MRFPIFTVDYCLNKADWTRIFVRFEVLIPRLAANSYRYKTLLLASKRYQRPSLF